MLTITTVVPLIITATVPIAILFFGPLADVARAEALLLASSALLALAGAIYGLRESGQEAKKRSIEK